VGLPLAPLTLTVTVDDCAVVMLDAEGVTVTVGATAGPANLTLRTASLALSEM
jgi:hypothetical protein